MWVRIPRYTKTRDIRSIHLVTLPGFDINLSRLPDAITIFTPPSPAQAIRGGRSVERRLPVRKVGSFKAMTNKIDIFHYLAWGSALIG